MSRTPEPLPPALKGRFRVSSALAAGASRRRMRAADLERPFWGVRIAPTDVESLPGGRDQGTSPAMEDAEALARITSYAPRLSPLAFFSHLSAARVLGIPLPRTSDEPVHVSVLRPHRAPRGVGVQGHEIDPRLVSVRQVNGMRIASPASVWAQLGPMLDLRDLVAVGDAIVRVPRLPGGRPGDPGSALATVDDLRAALTAGRRLGADRLREALPMIRPGAASRPETHLRLEMIEARLPEPQLDFEVRDVEGRLLGISELAYPERKVAVEYEGDHHRLSTRQWNRDIEKYEQYAAAGWSVVQVTAEHLYGDRACAADRVRAALRRRGFRA